MYYKRMFRMCNKHNFNMQYIDNMIPFELEIYEEFILEELKNQS